MAKSDDVPREDFYGTSRIILFLETLTDFYRPLTYGGVAHRLPDRIRQRLGGERVVRNEGKPNAWSLNLPRPKRLIR